MRTHLRLPAGPKWVYPIYRGSSTHSDSSMVQIRNHTLHDYKTILIKSEIDALLLFRQFDGETQQLSYIQRDSFLWFIVGEKPATKFWSITASYNVFTKTGKESHNTISQAQ